MTSLILMVVGAILVNNFVLNRFLGICPFLGVSKRLETSLGMSGAVIFVMTGAAAVTWCVQHYILGAELAYLQTISFILVIATFVQVIEMFLKRFMPPLYNALGIYLPLITTNCAVLGVAVMNVSSDKGLLESTLFATAAGIGFALALTIFTGLREKLDRANPPYAFRGIALALVTAGLLSLAFMGFSGLVK